MSKMTIIEGNSNDKDNTRVFMVKGEKGVSPTVSATKEGKVATVTVTDFEGTDTVEIDDGFSPTVQTTKVGDTATITITDAEGEHNFTLQDGSTAPPHIEVLYDNSNNTSNSINLSDSIFNYRYIVVKEKDQALFAYIQIPIYDNSNYPFYTTSEIYLVNTNYMLICMLSTSVTNNGQTLYVAPQKIKIGNTSPYYEEMSNTSIVPIKVWGVR